MLCLIEFAEHRLAYHGWCPALTHFVIVPAVHTPGPITFISPGLQSALAINGVNPSAITSPNIPQTLFSTIIPVGVVGPSTIPPGPYYKAPLPANTS